MATLLLSTLGTAVGGPLGGAAGAVLGNRLDRGLGASTGWQGARLQDLTATTSAYGQPVPRHCGRVRAAGTIIWATDLAESRETQGGGKGQPSMTAYTYTASFAVALASRPITGLGRIWADGQLLRGAAGDMKVAGTLRLHHGHGDQLPDPLIAADTGAACPAFRGIAYCVFEGLQLAAYGNRIPALTFEILADEGEVSLAELVLPAGAGVQAEAALPGLAGWSDEGGGLAAQLDAIDALYPLSFRQDVDRLKIAGCDQADAPILLPEAAAVSDGGEDEMQLMAGQSRAGAGEALPAGIRYYDVERDYQIGTQLTGGRDAGFALLDFAGTLRPAAARLLASRLRQRAAARAAGAVWRMVELDPEIVPGATVQLPDRPGRWRVESWELDADGVVVELTSLPPAEAQAMPADAGRVLPQPDLPNGPTILAALELPSFTDIGQVRQVHAAVSAEAAGWAGAALYLEQDDDLLPVGHARARRSTVGVTVTALASSTGVMLERDSSVEIDIPADLPLGSVTADALAGGANRALIGEEIVQFVTAERLEGGRWRLGGLLRGRGATELAAARGHAPGSRFVLLDDTLTPVDLQQTAADGTMRLAAIGLADAEPVLAEVANPGGSVRPPAPVHVRRTDGPDGSVAFRWTERIGGAWGWPDVPAAGPAGRCQVGIGPAMVPLAGWFVEGTALDLSAATLGDLRARHAGQQLWLRQVGREALSDPVLLMIL